MKNFLKSFCSFLLTVSVAIIAFDNGNKIYTVFELFGIKELALKKVILTALITLLIALMNAVLLSIKNKCFNRLEVGLKFQVDGRDMRDVEFIPSSNQYKEKKIDISLIITPGSPISMIFLKYFDFKIDIFFNPTILDVTLELDPIFMTDLEEKSSISMNKEGVLSFFLLKDFQFGGRNKCKFVKTGSFFIKPIRLTNDTTQIDFKLNNGFLRDLIFGKNLSVISIDELNVSCKKEC